MQRHEAAALLGSAWKGDACSFMLSIFRLASGRTSATSRAIGRFKRDPYFSALSKTMREYVPVTWACAHSRRPLPRELLVGVEKHGEKPWARSEQSRPSRAMSFAPLVEQLRDMGCSLRPQPATGGSSPPPKLRGREQRQDRARTPRRPSAVAGHPSTCLGSPLP